MPTLPKKGSKRIGFSPELRAKPVASLKFYLDSTATRSNSHHAYHEKNRGNTSTPPATANLFHRISANVAWALRQIFSKKRTSSRTSWRGPAQAEVTPSNCCYVKEQQPVKGKIFSSFARSAKVDMAEWAMREDWGAATLLQGNEHIGPPCGHRRRLSME
ncbi:hypothetical protein HPP92_013928 [Vanilla planifolia]|uniref:Uncharacterized protein n=1 Tax=Vanilla planifolia TaxID=51239 RepID=A0A835QUY3_VANPL|nr:hypothetical protein HPP92_013928 [Vanilla planifolia]